VYRGSFEKADLYLKSQNVKASVECRIASCVFRNKFSLVNVIHNWSHYKLWHISI